MTEHQGILLNLCREVLKPLQRREAIEVVEVLMGDYKPQPPVSTKEGAPSTTTVEPSEDDLSGLT